MNQSNKHSIQFFRIAIVLFVISIVVQSCEPWSETADTSQVSYLPSFELVDGNFQSFVVQDSAEYSDPGAQAYADTKELQVYSFGEVDLTEIGVYTIVYYAENGHGLSNTAERIIAVTNNDVSQNDLSGKYTGTIWSPQVEMTVKKVDDAGLYKCTDVMGYPGAEMKGEFVDLGKGELILIHGEGDFGRFATSEGEYTLSTLTWTIGLVDEPYTGVEVGVLWRKVRE